MVPDPSASSSSFTGLMQTPVQSERLQMHPAMASTSNMEMSVSNMSMPDISEEEALQMDSPGFYLGLIGILIDFCYSYSKPEALLIRFSSCG